MDKCQSAALVNFRDLESLKQKRKTGLLSHDKNGCAELGGGETHCWNGWQSSGVNTHIRSGMTCSSKQILMSSLEYGFPQGSNLGGDGGKCPIGIKKQAYIFRVLVTDANKCIALCRPGKKRERERAILYICCMEMQTRTMRLGHLSFHWH